MELSIVITHYRDFELLKQCLVVLREEIKETSVEIIVILSEYQQKTLEYLKQTFPEIKLFPFKENIYFVRSVNRGLEQAKGEFILIINDDVIVSRGSIRALIDFLRFNPDVGLVGPRIVYPDGSSQPSCFRFYTPLTIVCRRTFLGKTSLCQKNIDSFLYRDKNLDQADRLEVEWLSNGAGVLTRKVHVERVGLLDERFRHYFSDVDWSKRFWQSGFKVVYFPQVFFTHYHGKRSRGNALIIFLTNHLARMHIWDGIKYFWKWGLKRP